MAGTEYKLNPVTHITTGAIGPAGKRVFYLQARQASEVVTLIVEKAQVQALAVGLEQYLQELAQRFPTCRRPAPSSTRPKWRSAAARSDLPRRAARIGGRRTSDRLVLVARELQPEGADPDEASVARLWCTRSQLLMMCRWGVEVAGHGRPICGNCGEPIDPEGHFCPKRNGHKH